eukprot:15445152-Alexandrium_andersonii.AAC.1
MAAMALGCPLWDDYLRAWEQWALDRAIGRAMAKLSYMRIGWSSVHHRQAKASWCGHGLGPSAGRPGRTSSATATGSGGAPAGSRATPSSATGEP